MSIKHELQDIISGNGSVSFGKNIQAITHDLRRKKEAISKTKTEECSKDQETKALIEYISANDLWYSELDETKYIGEGAEQKVYEYHEPHSVIKLNDAVFYAYWYDYLNSLLIHNFLFKELAYELLGFNKIGDKLYAVVRQLYVKATETTNLQHVRDFLIMNGFKNKKNNDYYHSEIGIIIEDLHDENVLSNEGVLQFIDTVIYLTDLFYE